jgi:hypothetical protein
MNYLVYLASATTMEPRLPQRRELAQRSFALFSKEETEKGHVHENYNAIAGDGDDVTNSDKFYHWGALLGYMEYLGEHRTRSNLLLRSLFDSEPFVGSRIVRVQASLQ